MWVKPGNVGPTSRSRNDKTNGGHSGQTLYGWWPVTYTQSCAYSWHLKCMLKIWEGLPPYWLTGELAGQWKAFSTPRTTHRFTANSWLNDQNISIVRSAGLAKDSFARLHCKHSPFYIHTKPCRDRIHVRECRLDSEAERSFPAKPSHRSLSSPCITLA